MPKRRTPYTIGRGKPPRATRFQRGQSGNPNGRPKGSGFAHSIAKELKDRVPITLFGKEKKLSKRDVIVKQAVNKAATGDLKALSALAKLAREEPAAASEDHPSDIFVGPYHKLVMAEIVRRIRSMEEEPSDDDALEDHQPPVRKKKGRMQ